MNINGFTEEQINKGTKALENSFYPVRNTQGEIVKLRPANISEITAYLVEKQLKEIK